MALVHILVDLLDGLDRSNGLHIDVTAIPPNETPGVTDHPSVLNLLCPVPSTQLMCPDSVAPPGASIGVFSDSSVHPEQLRKACGTSAIDHAGCVRIVSHRACEP